MVSMWIICWLSMLFDCVFLLWPFLIVIKVQIDWWLVALSCRKTESYLFNIMQLTYHKHWKIFKHIIHNAMSCTYQQNDGLNRHNMNNVQHEYTAVAVPVIASKRVVASCLCLVPCKHVFMYLPDEWVRWVSDSILSDEKYQL